MGVFGGGTALGAFLYVLLAWRFGWPDETTLVAFVGLVCGVICWSVRWGWSHFGPDLALTRGRMLLAGGGGAIAVVLAAALLLTGCAATEPMSAKDAGAKAGASPPPPPPVISAPMPSAKPAPPPAPGGGVSPIQYVGRALLLSGQAEERHYGMYSYVLIRRTDLERVPAALALLRAYHTELPPVSEVEALGVKTGGINLMYLPVTTTRGLAFNAPSEWYQLNYDFSRAETYLKNLGARGRNTSGVLVVAALKPLDKPLDQNAPVLVWDMGRYRPEDVLPAMQAFLQQVREPDFSQPGALTALRANLWKMVRAWGYSQDSIKLLPRSS